VEADGVEETEPESLDPESSLDVEELSSLDAEDVESSLDVDES